MDYQAISALGPMEQATTGSINAFSLPNTICVPSGDNPPQCGMHSLSLNEPEPIGITYMVNVGGKFKACQRLSTEKYKNWHAAIVEVSGFAQTYTFKHELAWKMYSAPKNQDPVAIDNKSDYKMMICEVENVSVKKEPTVAIIISNLPKDNAESSCSDKQTRKSKKARIEQQNERLSSPATASDSEADSESRPHKIPGALSVHELEELIRKNNAFCESHQEHCHVSSAHSSEGHHIVLTQSMIKHWAQQIGVASIKEIPKFFLKEANSPAPVKAVEKWAKNPLPPTLSGQ
ncbi:uncharacterized protein EI90DRAFT_3126443 [Cantharellus anzutake]|uniref:uncharacterized protein n=1 Tax=Cantharellus anzutake TaxID=1750568 RepID=UPI00190638D7|nr:uncharacterized protein EI90DRAFT_3126443 [Cantharellus anzutake]KAF8328263.1 hypothetical protein EI90DRAFT_3126443 [Cantharellus anzutake]